MATVLGCLRQRIIFADFLHTHLFLWGFQAIFTHIDLVYLFLPAINISVLDTPLRIPPLLQWWANHCCLFFYFSFSTSNTPYRLCTVGCYRSLRQALVTLKRAGFSFVRLGLLYMCRCRHHHHRHHLFHRHVRTARTRSPPLGPILPSFSVRLRSG